MPSTLPHVFLYGDSAMQGSSSHDRSAAGIELSSSQIQPIVAPLVGNGGQSTNWNASRPYFGGLEVQDAFASHGNSPQSSNGSLLSTPYQTGAHIAEVNSPSRYVPQHHDAGLLRSSASPLNSLGLELVAQPKSPLGISSGHLANEGHWTHPPVPGRLRPQDAAQNPRPYYGMYLGCQVRAEASPSPDPFDAQGSVQLRPFPHGRSHSHDEFLTSSLSAHPSPFVFAYSQVDMSFGHNRSLSSPPSMSDDFTSSGSDIFHSPNASNGGTFGSGSQYFAPEAPMQSFPPTSCTTVQPIFGTEETAPVLAGDPSSQYSGLVVDRVGSDRTRAISQQRRTNSGKKLFYCPLPSCGATITSRHNFKSHQNSHLGIKPYACKQGDCSRFFGTRAEAKRHRTKHCRYRPSQSDINE